ncbi:hypothetical protein PFLmoz3_00721 [Pseudomonas fluorescens]|uniref:Uncharacterized protein n=1 Tax=Pseudomonas fluorescens TaxID=294 RepID=A0A125QJ39_PSEFL|nr:hypothetical protein PFLmoz3_00721 [Pseudomonas fluorescens]
MAGQGRLDFPQFDAHATDFYLVVIAPQVVEIAVWQPARQVAGAVHATAAERVVDKPFGTQLGTVQVPPRHALAADIQLPRHANRHRALLRVQQVDAGIGDRRADMQRLAHLNARRGRHNGGFGGAIVVHHRKRLRLGEGAQAVAADQQGAQGGMPQPLAEGIFGHRRGQETHIQWLRAPPAEQRVDIFRTFMGRWQVQGRTHAQCRPDFPGHGIKTEAGDAGSVAARMQVERLAMPVHQVRHAVMFDHHTLGQPGGTRGVNHISQVRRRDGNLRVTVDGCAARLQRDHRYRRDGQTLA